jgi:hypothetical protein
MLLVADLRMLHVALRVVQGNQGENRDASMSVATARLETRVDEQLRRVREAFGTSRVPSDVDAAQTAIATYCGLRERTASANAAAVIESVWGLYFDLLGRIATITMEAEATLAETV